MKLIARLEKNYSFWFLVIISFIFFILRWPSLFEPYWYGDEGVYQAVGMLLKAGHPLYSGGWENKPPILLLIYAFFNSDQFLIRTASLISGLISVWFFYLVSLKLFPKSNKVSMIITTIYAIIFGTRIVEGNIANAENFMLLPILISAYLILAKSQLKKIWQNKVYFLAGIVLSLAFLTKIVAAFDFLAFGLFLFISSSENLKHTLIKRIYPFASGFIVPVILTASYFLLTNNFKDFMSAFFFGNIGYVGIGNQFIIPQGLLYIKSILLLIFVAFVYFKKKTIPANVAFITLWFAFSLFDVFFSQRSYAHYLIMIIPSFCLMIGLILYQKRERLFAAFFLILAFLLISHSFSFKGRLISYYANLIAFCSGREDVNSYQSFFDPNTSRDYEIARYIRVNTSKNDSIFIWGNNAQVYKLSNKTPIMRYTVAYHIVNYKTGISEMENAIKTKKPKLIIVMPDIPAYPLDLGNYQQKIIIRNAIVYEKIF